MASFSAYDGTTLAYHVFGDGPPVVCLPGGPMQASAYLGDLGGLGARRRLVMVDLRGSGASGVPADPGSYRCDRLVDDVEALREHLGLERVDLLGHCAGANLTVGYAARHPERLGRLALITPSVMAVGLAVSGELRLETARLRRGEPWFPEAFAALEAIVAGEGTDWDAIAPFWYGRWDKAARAHQAAGPGQQNGEAAAVYGSEGAFAPDATRAALRTLDAPVFLLSGEVDVAAPPPTVAEYAGLFPNAEAAIVPGAGHFPWLDNAALFTAATAAFLE
jgi:pimeloyl-ACP methyl ester carboxylesterase